MNLFDLDVIIDHTSSAFFRPSFSVRRSLITIDPDPKLQEETATAQVPQSGCDASTRSFHLDKEQFSIKSVEDANQPLNRLPIIFLAHHDVTALFVIGG